MKISVIVPAYNSEAFLRETLDCLINQTLKDIQIIVVNDGSTDSTADIIEEYAAKHPNILPVYQENAGVSAARNNGIERSEGKYTMFLDSDDLITEDTLENVFAALEKANADMAVFRVMRFGFGGEEYNPIVEALAKESEINCFDKRLLWNFLVANKCYRTDMLKNSGVRFPALKYSEDGAFLMQFIYKARPKITGVYSAVLKYRRHTPSEGLSVSQRVNLSLAKDFTQAHAIVYRAAQEALGNSKPDYLQEIIYKNYFALITEFYRLLWNGDDETLAFIGKQSDELKAKMTPETLKKCQNAVRDIGEPLFSKAEIAENPIVSVIVKNCSEEFLSALYSQSMPVFELIVPQSANAPERENVTVLPDKGFSKEAKKRAKGTVKIFLSGKIALDLRFLKIVSMLKKSRKFGAFPDFMIKLGALLFLKIKR